MKKAPQTSNRLAIFDGLKGILILIILCYYFFQHILPGGFLAVNFFLLIAGFFTTRHFYTADARGKKIRLLHYYQSRIERLFFPMLAMIVTVVTYIVIFDRQFYYNLRNMAFSSLVFFNNYYQILSNQSYFVQSANPSAFTHLWYVSLYAQLVVITPILMLLFYSWHKKPAIAANMFAVTSLLSAIVLGYLYRDNQDPSRIYYDLLTRGFAFTLGGSIGFLFPVRLKPKRMQPKTKTVLNIMGTIMVILSFLMLKFMYGTQPFAYRFGMTLYTICSGLLLVTAIHPDTFWHKVLSVKLLTFFGKRSLSYYLWFYPIHLLAPNKLSFLSQNIWASIAVQFFLIVFFAEISYRIFEKRQPVLPFGQDFDIKKTIQQVKYLLTHKGVLLNIKIMSIAYLFVFVIGLVAVIASPETKSNVAQDVQKVIEENIQKAEETKSESVEEVKVINNIEGLSQEVMLHANALEVTFVGDSILAAGVDKIKEVFPKAVTDTQIGRHLYQSVPVIISLKQQHLLKDTVVTVLGTNSTFTEGQINDYIEAVGRERELFFVTVALDKDWANDANRQIFAAAQRYGNVKVIDWDSYSSTHPEWYYEDGIHPNQEGALAFAKYIAEQIYLQR